MKNVSLLVLAGFLLIPVVAYSADAPLGIRGIDCFRTLNRNASIEVDAAIHNPAGLAWMEKDGLYLSYNHFFVFQKRGVRQKYPYVNNFTLNGSPLPSSLEFVVSPLREGDNPANPDGNYDATSSQPLGIDFIMVYKRGRMALFGHGGGAAECGGAKYKKGLPHLDFAYLTMLKAAALLSGHTLTSYSRDSSFEGNELFMDFVGGLALRLNRVLSAAVSGRLVRASTYYAGYLKNVHSTADFSIGIGDDPGWDAYTKDPERGDLQIMDLRVKATGLGYCWGFTAGLDLMPSKEVNIGLKYIYYTPLVIKVKGSDETTGPAPLLNNDAFKTYRDGSRVKRTIPMTAGIGISYRILENLRIDTSFDYVLASLVKYGEGFEEITDRQRDGIRTGAGLEYRVFSILRFGVGYQFSRISTTRTDLISDELSSHNYSCGASCTFFGNLDMMIGFIYSTYLTQVSSMPLGAGVPVGGMDVEIRTTLKQTLTKSGYWAGAGLTYRVNI